jgi:thioredoxin 2
VLDTNEINAFACPGGIIFVTKGMLRVLWSEDQPAVRSNASEERIVRFKKTAVSW